MMRAFERLHFAQHILGDAEMAFAPGRFAMLSVTAGSSSGAEARAAP